jgi:membrane protein implicated in regulation of membrane protease activity
VDSPETWQWIWVGCAVLFAFGELATPGSFFLAPFAVGAAAAAVLGFLDVNIGVQWLTFLVISGGSFAALRPIARRLDQTEPSRGIGARRLIGESGIVLNEIPAGPSALGMIRVGREEWRAESVDGTPVAEGTLVKVVKVTGTRVVVWPEDRPAPVQPPTRDPEKGISP